MREKEGKGGIEGLLRERMSRKKIEGENEVFDFLSSAHNYVNSIKNYQSKI